MKLIGLTGNAGSGKSTVRKFYEDKGVPCLDADLIAHEIYQRDSALVARLVDVFGVEILDQDEQISRPQLATIAFANQSSTKLLNNIVHPAIFEQIQAWIDSQRQLNPQPDQIIIEATLIIEAGRAEFYDEIWVVTVDEQIQFERLRDRGWSDSEIQNRLSKQLPQTQKTQFAAKVIENNENIQKLFLSLAL